MCCLEECKVQDVGGATSANADGYISFTCKYRNINRENKLIFIFFSFVKEASISRNRFKNEVVTRISIKRKVGYSDDEIAETRKRMSRLRIE